MKLLLLVLASLLFVPSVSFSQETRIFETQAIFPRHRGTALEPPVARLPDRGYAAYSASASGVTCGPSPIVNTLSCYDLQGGSRAPALPIPGRVTTVPLFHEAAWFVGTSEGYFIRIEATKGGSFPRLGASSIEFWGLYARQFMHDLRPALSEKEVLQRRIPEGEQPLAWTWRHAGSSDFIGTPVIQNGRIFVLASNQFLHAFDAASGRLLWAQRLSADVPLRLSSVALSATAKEVLVGNNEGYLVALDPGDGKQLWRASVPSKPDERFPAIVAHPLVVDRSVVVSNAAHLTERLNLDSQVIEWSFPVGSVAKVRESGPNVIIGGSDGSVVALDKVTGALVWRTAVSSESPIASIGTIRRGALVFVASQNGTIFLLDGARGTILDKQDRLGDVLGEFFPGANAEEEVCLTFSTPGLRCFAEKVF